MKTVLITGTTSGIGQQLALDYAAQGWQVIACGRNAEKLITLQQQAGADQLRTLTFDITQRDEVLAASTTLSQRSQVLDLVILNAGTNQYIDNAREFDSQIFEHIIKTNVLGVGYCLEAFTRHLRRGGQLALVGSSAYLFPFTRAEAYGASKAAVAYLAQSLTIDLKPHDIAVSLIVPGFVETPLTDKNDFKMPMRISVQQASREIQAGLAKRLPLIGTPKLFTGILRFMSILPYRLQLLLAQRMVRQ
ncbi:MAG: SDR family NAD(P)-dependent oxidoreductase [Thiofilum sp.]|uniref:SDR family NAD(P)-dependent oxidoreductase n=1 Tax=Thiofilum sp. TaxID=2212733 RepID=UPI0025F2FFDC|nr:SDR family NAD(P)-dependent oxidoreductase [Thiofilum sp.]MBK8455380.1 SDR family NAD(P)-dependent oxidoreductase [Thiofilum sp.]